MSFIACVSACLRSYLTQYLHNTAYHGMVQHGTAWYSMHCTARLADCRLSLNVHAIISYPAKEVVEIILILLAIWVSVNELPLVTTAVPIPSSRHLIIPLSALFVPSFSSPLHLFFIFSSSSLHLLSLYYSTSINPRYVRV